MIKGALQVTLSCLEKRQCLRHRKSNLLSLSQLQKLSMLQQLMEHVKLCCCEMYLKMMCSIKEKGTLLMCDNS